MAHFSKNIICLLFLQVWDVLTNEEVVDIVASAPVRSYAARSLVEAAVRSWRIKYPTSRVDDCAVVCLFLDSEGSTSTSNADEACNGWSLNSTECDENTPLDPLGPDSLDRSSTVRVSDGLQDDGMEVEGVARVDTLLTLPRFVPDT